VQPTTLIGGLFAVAVIRVALVWDRLPPFMASHFGASGRPDGWMSRGGFFLFYAVVFGFVIGVMLAVPRMVAVLPVRLVNLPNRDYWLAPERRQVALRRLGDAMAWFAVALGLLGAIVLELVVRSNLERAPLSNVLFLLALGGFFAFTIGWLVWLVRAFRVPSA